MKQSVRTKFGIGMIFTLLITLVLLGSSAYYLNKLSEKSGIILKENYQSLVFAREMNQGLSKINHEIITAYLANKAPDLQIIGWEINGVNQSLQLEKNNFTEPGEDKLVSGFESDFTSYCDSLKNSGDKMSAVQLDYFRKKEDNLAAQLLLLSQMNGKALESKTEAATVFSKNALTGMTILGSLCFLIALVFIYSFASYFNERFTLLHNGIREIAASNYEQRLYFDGNDEFFEISVLFNQLAEKLSIERNTSENRPIEFIENEMDESDEADKEELKFLVDRMKTMEKQADKLLKRIDSDK